MRKAGVTKAKSSVQKDQRSELTCARTERKAAKLNAEWRKLSTRFLPVVTDDPAWRYSRPAKAGDAAQGWKLHLSATILNAGAILKKVAPFLISRDIQFKAPASLQLLLQLNSGVSFGYSQVGKFITIYPRTNDEAVRLASHLHKLTDGMRAPAVPFDLQYCRKSCVYYRYGAFKYEEIENSDGRKIPAIRDLTGQLVPDLRDKACPDWADNPFRGVVEPEISQEESKENPLRSTYHIFRALKQRGKGGVYQAIDVGTNPPRICVVKEGRASGESYWDGCDGFQMVKGEAKILKKIESLGVNVPRFYSSFELDGNYYLVTEFVEGQSLDELMMPRKRRFSIRQIFKYARQIAGLLAQIHDAGWVWRDCKPANLIITKTGLLRPLDFEGACLIGQPTAFNWRTAEFSASENKGFLPIRASEAEDIYSLGTVVYYLLTGKIYQPDSSSVRASRRNVPAAAEALLDKILVLPLRKKRPSARSLIDEFDRLLNFIK